MKNASLFAEIFGLGVDDQLGFDERVHNVRALAAIGSVVGLPFAIFNMLMPGAFALGVIELVAVLGLVLPAWVLGRRRLRPRLGENLLALAGLIIFTSLFVLGGVAGAGILWVYVYPFQLFFLKGQRLGWRYGLAYLALVVAYAIWIEPRLAFVHHYPAQYQGLAIAALAFYMLVASAFNLVRIRFEERLQQRIAQESAAAGAYLGELQFRATHDALTGLPNRVLLLEEMQRLIDANSDADQGLVVCNLRMERLSELGNVVGLDRADHLVRQLAAHLTRVTHGKGVVARARRDEFIVVYPLPRDELGLESLQRLIGSNEFSAHEQGYSLHLALTLGMCSFPIHATEPLALLHKAEQAMLQAAKSGQKLGVYDEEQDQVFVRHHLLFGKLRDALHDDALRLHFQPQVDLHSGRIIGAEALARWLDADAGAISPSTFVPIAEESGLIRPLTSWVANAAMRACASWRAQGLELAVSINISAPNLADPQLLGTLLDAAQAAGLAPRHVNLELTESCLMVAPEPALDTMRRLHDAGFRLSIDDFGTGFSSLSYLQNLPIHELKIDQSFVRDLPGNPRNQAIVRSTIDLAHNFGLAVVAEGIEDPAAADWLRERGCDIGQGYAYARPLPEPEFVAHVLAAAGAARA
jgi:diguanylate cyclase (GGDEF)-like protein